MIVVVKVHQMVFDIVRLARFRKICVFAVGLTGSNTPNSEQWPSEVRLALVVKVILEFQVEIFNPKMTSITKAG